MMLRDETMPIRNLVPVYSHVKVCIASLSFSYGEKSRSLD